MSANIILAIIAFVGLTIALGKRSYEKNPNNKIN